MTLSRAALEPCLNFAEFVFGSNAIEDLGGSQGFTRCICHAMMSEESLPTHDDNEPEYHEPSEPASSSNNTDADTMDLSGLEVTQHIFAMRIFFTRHSLSRKYSHFSKSTKYKPNARPIGLKFHIRKKTFMRATSVPICMAKLVSNYNAEVNGVRPSDSDPVVLAAKIPMNAIFLKYFGRNVMIGDDTVKIERYLEVSQKILAAVERTLERDWMEQD
ncbi:hypothetical protein BJ878DRAFT_578106 [Calycina marina]|uniref:Uncharacterized protein n=1 Tax=Calycina marina TaxID=1763456 RepID=A0A9P7YXK5_9HELO|nr:hypothetical protein BJ878DRAFT_578106 [Calycina marina]